MSKDLKGPSAKRPRREYLPHIDVLRAVAILAVVGFHWQIPGFKGGYVGVDVFFVISGFLITRLIVNDISAHDFSFLNFYIRRARRLLPALYLTAFSSILVGWFVMLPPAMLELDKSAVSTIAFVSNFFFWSGKGYFESESSEKPLLHTWSLSVEEQFYFIVPAMIWLIWRFVPDANKRLMTFLWVLALFSFCYCCLISRFSKDTAFFFPTSRAWEFLIGAHVDLCTCRSFDQSIIRACFCRHRRNRSFDQSLP